MRFKMDILLHASLFQLLMSLFVVAIVKNSLWSLPITVSLCVYLNYIFNVVNDYLHDNFKRK